MSSIRVVVVVVALGIVVAAFFPLISLDKFKIGRKVLELDESNFDATISSFDFIFVDFYVPWCVYSKLFFPELDKAAPMLSGLKEPIVAARVNADKYYHLASRYRINGFPTLKIFVHGVPIDYDGPKKADLLVQSLRKYIAPDVAILESDSAITEFVEAAVTSFPIFIGFGLNESAISELAIKYKKRAWFSVAKEFSENITAFYDFDKVPALVALNQSSNEQSIFYGPFEDRFLEEFLKTTLPINHDTRELLKGGETISWRMRRAMRREFITRKELITLLEVAAYLVILIRLNQ